VSNTTATQRVVIEPVTRVEGHGKVSLLLDDDNQLQQARVRFRIVDFGFRIGRCA
jgi:NAD-reducing hydrogenase large subunit